MPIQLISGFGIRWFQNDREPVAKSRGLLALSGPVLTINKIQMG